MTDDRNTNPWRKAYEGRWQPISTAPKASERPEETDAGPLILVTDGEFYEIVEWIPDSYEDQWEKVDADTKRRKPVLVRAGYWQPHNDDGAYENWDGFGGYTPRWTHWARLPELPKP